MPKPQKSHCYYCNKEVEYTIRKETIENYKSIKVNVEENIGVCTTCKEDIYVPALEKDNFKRLYAKYENLGGIVNKKQK